MKTINYLGAIGALTLALTADIQISQAYSIPKYLQKNSNQPKIYCNENQPIIIPLPVMEFKPATHRLPLELKLIDPDIEEKIKNPISKPESKIGAALFPARK